MTHETSVDAAVRCSPDADREPWVDAETVAAYVSATREWVYDNASTLGARRLGNGPKARLRFRLSLVDASLTVCTAGRTSDLAPVAQVHRSRRRTSRSMGTGVELLPIRGRS